MHADALVIGSGIAGLRASISLADAGRVSILTKADPRESNTGYAQGGIAAAVGPEDTPELHAHDTTSAGDGLCLQPAVDVLVHDGPRYVAELVDWGARFDVDPQGRIALGREAAHSVRRVLHASDATGREIARVLWQKVAAHPRIRILEDALAMTVLVSGGVCRGATFVDRDGRLRHVEAPATLIATGGAGQVYRETTNPTIATGDGIAMAAEAGARVADLEFVQFHPTVLAVEGAPRFLLSEALRGEGAVLVNHAGERFMQRAGAAGDLAPRDVVARAITREASRTGKPVYLSMAHLDAEYVRRRFPTITQACRDAGLDLATDRIPLSPAAHYLMGGIETDVFGRTSMAGLFAAGEAACTGLHGANRLASNSLLEGLVFGARAAQAMQAPWRPAALFAEMAARVPPPPARPELPTADDVRDLMWQTAGLLRRRSDLETAVAKLAAWRTATQAARMAAPADREHRRLASLVTVGYLIACAARRREESRGAHFRTDFPRRDDIHWQRHLADVLPPESPLR